MISERVLRKWRGEALKSRERLVDIDTLEKIELGKLTQLDRILRMTQELLDQHLLRRKT